ncbi:IclR family transcriptional regulator [Streptomyces sp. NPDC047081]|uniref:IclR family transcriptional regulator n=1 Tax=Streptomyces sp. NPDC047081 TaxID=3154706 RepID=UPI0033EDAA1D
MARSDAHESVIARAARVLEAFDHDHPVLTVAEIGRKADVPVPTAHRLVNQLVEVGFLERTGAGQVRIGMHLWELASLGARARDLREAAMPYLEDIHAATRQHTQLMVLDGTDVLVVEQLRARHALDGILLAVGRRMPAHTGSGGLVLLANADRALQEEVLSGSLVRFTGRTPADADSLRRIWAGARREGWLVCDGYIDPRALGIAVPVRGADGRVVASLGVVIPSEGAVPSEHIPVLLAGARGIGRALQAPKPVQPRRVRYMTD